MWMKKRVWFTLNHVLCCEWDTSFKANLSISGLNSQNFCRRNSSDGVGWEMTQVLDAPLSTDSTDAILLTYAGEHLVISKRVVFERANDMEDLWLGGSHRQWKQNDKHDISVTGLCILCENTGHSLSPTGVVKIGRLLIPKMYLKRQMTFHLSSRRTKRYTHGSRIGLNDASLIISKEIWLMSINWITLVWHRIVNIWGNREISGY